MVDMLGSANRNESESVVVSPIEVMGGAVGDSEVQASARSEDEQCMQFERRC